MNFHLDTLLNLPSATVETCSYHEGEVYLQLRVLAEGISCPNCGHYTEELHQNRPILIRDLPVFGRIVYLKVPRRQFYCPKCQRYSTERLEFVSWERRYTQRYEENIYQRVQNSSIEQVSREEGLSSEKIQGIFDHKSKEIKKKEWSEVKRLSLDEISMRKGHQDFVTVVGDIDPPTPPGFHIRAERGGQRRGQLIEVIDSHKQEDIIQVLRGCLKSQTSRKKALRL